MFFACSVTLTAIIVLQSLAARKAKMPMEHRILHIRCVIFTIIYAIAAVASFSNVLGLINLVLSIPFVKGILFFFIPQSNLTAGFYWIITLLSCVFLISLYCSLLHTLHAVWLRSLSKKNYLESKSILEKVMNFIARWFYERGEEVPMLSPAKINVGKWIRVMRIFTGIMFIVVAVIITVCLQFGFSFIPGDLFSRFVKSVYMIPVVSYVILEQLELFLAADIKKGERLIDTEHINKSMWADFDSLAMKYERMFGGKSLISGYKGNVRQSVNREIFAGIQEEQKERVKNPELLEALCRNVQCVTELASYHINGLIDLINGKHFAIFTPLWSEYDAYYLAFVQHQLEMGNTALVLCGTNQEAEIVQRRFTSVLKKMNVADSVWRVNKHLNAVDSETDILICTEEQFLNGSIDVQYPEFNRKLKLVIVSNIYELLCREEAYFEHLFNHFNEDIQFIFYVSENNTDIRNEIQERISNRPVGLSENPSFNSEANILFWRSEAFFKPQLLLSERLYHDFGVAYTIAIVAAEQHVPCVNIVASGSVPTETYSALVNAEYKKILMEDYLRESSINLNSVIKNNSYSDSSMSQLPFTIVYDTQNNLLNVAKTWLSSNEAPTSMLHIVSEPYMFRDYFAANVASLFIESTGLQLLVPGKSLNLHAPAIAMLLKMRNGIKVEELLKFAEEYELEEDSVEALLEKLLVIVFDKTVYYDVYTTFSYSECSSPEFVDGEFVYTSIITLVDDDIYDRLCRETKRFVRFEGAYECILPINVDDVYNYFLAKQHVSVDGKRYAITDISKGAVHLTIEETVDMEKRYTSLYRITEFERIKDYKGYTLSTEKKTTDFFEAKITREIDSYFAYPGSLLFSETANTSLVKLPEPIVETKRVSCLHITLRCPLENCSNKVANTLCYVLNGAMKTFLPENYKDILVFSKLDMKRVCEGVNMCEESDLLPDPIPSDLLTGFESFEAINPDICKLVPSVEGSAVESNTDEELHLYIAHFSETDTGVITAIGNDLERILLTIYKYLSWIEGQEGNSANYIRFGYAETPGIFDVIGTLACLSRALPKQPEAFTDESNKDMDTALTTSDGEGEKRCSFCGRPIRAVGYKFDDKRIMCAECNSHITNEREEVRKLLREAVELMEKQYSITLPEGISINFKSAKAIGKEDPDGDVGRVLGFYNIKKNEIWVERGGPEPCVMSTLVHELTHAWQFANINAKSIELKYIEGHSSYVEVECLRLLKQSTYADYLENSLMAADSVYGEGYRFWKGYLATESDKNIFNNISEMF